MMAKSRAVFADEDEKRRKAWVGDAVLSLFAREWVLKQDDIQAGERKDAFVAMTSNRFLASFGEPTAIEAEIGVLYEQEGLTAAFEFMTETLLPVFQRQRNNQSKATRGSKKKR